MVCDAVDGRQTFVVTRGRAQGGLVSRQPKKGNVAESNQARSDNEETDEWNHHARVQQAQEDVFC